MWKRTLLAVTAIASALMAGIIVSPGCHSQLSPVSPKLAAESAMKGFAAMVVELTPEQRRNLTSIEQLYNHMDRLNGWDNFRSMSWSHVEWESGTRPRFDYIVHPNTSGVPDDEAILIATPCEIRIKYGEFARVALTHALKVIHITDREFHQRILDQSGSLDEIR